MEIDFSARCVWTVDIPDKNYGFRNQGSVLSRESVELCEECQGGEKNNTGAPNKF